MDTCKKKSIKIMQKPTSPDSSKRSVYSLTLKPPHYSCCLLLTFMSESQYFGVPEMERRLEENMKGQKMSLAPGLPL